METETDSDTFVNGLAVLFVLLLTVGGGLLFVLFENGAIHRLGLFTVGAGLLVGIPLLLALR